MALAKIAGFDVDDEAYQIGKYDRATDDEPGTNPMRVLNFLARRDYHFPTSTQLAARRSEALSCRAPLNELEFRAIGRYLHALEDSYAHQDYIQDMMHPPGGPDWPWNGPDRFVAMADAKFQALIELRKQCLADRPFDETKARGDFATFRSRLNAWAAAEKSQARGILSRGVKSRWAALEKDLYRDQHGRYTDEVPRTYDLWRQRQDANKWRTP